MTTELDQILNTVSPEAWRAEALRRSFRAFVEAAWPVVEPAHKFIPGWYVDALAEHLAAWSRGEIRRLIICQPPGTAKSIFSSVLLPAWIWTWRPEWRGLFASYSDALARRDSIRTRTLVTSPWYQQHFAIQLAEDRQDDFSNVASGRRMATSVAGRGTGFRAHGVVVDDPLSASEAFSEAARETAIRWFTQTLPSRVDDVEHAGFLVVMQRLHERDLAGYLLDAGLDYEAIILPAEGDGQHRSTSLGVYDRRPEGELLCPTIHSRAFLDEQRKTLGSYGYAGQYQQNPAPPDGGKLKTRWWRFFREPGTPEVMPRPTGCWTGPAIERPELQQQIISIDLSFKGGAHNDNTAMVVVGIRGSDRFVLDLVARPMEFVEQLAELQRLRAKWPEATKILVEDSANAAALVSKLHHSVAGIVPVRATGSKDARVGAASPQVESGNVYLRDGADWVDDLIHEATVFPRGRRDDRLDALVQCLLAIENVTPEERAREIRLVLNELTGLQTCSPCYFERKLPHLMPLRESDFKFGVPPHTCSTRLTLPPKPEGDPRTPEEWRAHARAISAWQQECDAIRAANASPVGLSGVDRAAVSFGYRFGLAPASLDYRPPNIVTRILG